MLLKYRLLWFRIKKNNIIRKGKKTKMIKVMFIFSFIVMFCVSIPVLAQESNKKSETNASQENSFSEDELFKALGVRNMVNEQAPSFVLKDVEGNEVSLEKLKGNVVLIDFWATWCAPCREELPYIEKIAEEFRGKGLVTLTISAEQGNIVSTFLSKNKYKIKSLVDSNKEVSSKYQVKGLPTAFVVDRDGKIVTHFIGGRDEENLRNELKKAGVGAN